MDRIFIITYMRTTRLHYTLKKIYNENTDNKIRSWMFIIFYFKVENWKLNDFAIVY